MREHSVVSGFVPQTPQRRSALLVPWGPSSWCRGPSAQDTGGLLVGAQGEAGVLPALKRSGASPCGGCVLPLTGSISPTQRRGCSGAAGAGRRRGAARVRTSWVVPSHQAADRCTQRGRDAVFLPEASSPGQTADRAGKFPRRLHLPSLLSTCRLPGSARRFRWHARVPVSRSAAEGPLRKAGGHVGLR